LNEGLKTIELMNHHVRNALNVIVLSTNVHSHGELLEGIQTSVSRIDWALREILHGRVLDDYAENAVEKNSLTQRHRWINSETPSALGTTSGKSRKRPLSRTRG